MAYMALTCGKKGMSRKSFIGCMFFLALFVGLADMLGGYDRYIYGGLFDNLADNIRDGGNLVFSRIFLLYPKELGYDFYNVIIAFITSNRYLFILITTLLVYYLFTKSILKYASNYTWALLVFTGLLFFFTFTYLRQILAAAIVCQSIKYILNRKFTIFFSIILLAATFHNSAILFLPFYFTPFAKLPRNKLILFIIIIAAIGISGISTLIYHLYGFAADNTGRSSIYTNDETGFRFAYVIEAFFFLALILFNYHRIPNSPQQILMCNIAIGFCCILLLFAHSEYGGRLSWYFLIGLISTISLIMAQIKPLSIGRGIMVCTFMLLYLRILFTWGNMLYPYKTFLTDGVRDNDIIYQENEYDNAYKNNKFYKL